MACRAASAAYHLAYNNQRRPETREAAKRQRARNPVAMREYAHRYKAENRDRESAYYRKWAAANPDKIRKHWTDQRARRKHAEGNHTAADLRAQCVRQKGRCFYGRKVNPDCAVSLKGGYHAEHVTPLTLGGSNGPENIVAACPHCNLTKNAKHPMDFAGILF